MTVYSDIINDRRMTAKKIATAPEPRSFKRLKFLCAILYAKNQRQLKQDVVVIPTQKRNTSIY